MPASPMPGSPAPAAAGGDDGNYFWRRVAATEPDGEDSAVFDERIPQEARPATYALLGTLLSRDTKFALTCISANECTAQPRM